jgi:carbon monoxide dehydrogenase subunit G
MKLINIKERIKLTSIEEHKTKLDFEIKINIGIPNKDEFENYIKIIFQNILDNLVEKLS